jgi:hypothetical protein
MNTLTELQLTVVAGGLLYNPTGRWPPGPVDPSPVIPRDFAADWQNFVEANSWESMARQTMAEAN